MFWKAVIRSPSLKHLLGRVNSGSSVFPPVLQFCNHHAGSLLHSPVSQCLLNREYQNWEECSRFGLNDAGQSGKITSLALLVKGLLREAMKQSTCTAARVHCCLSLNRIPWSCRTAMEKVVALRPD